MADLAQAPDRVTTLFTQAPFITGSIESLAQEGLLGQVFAVVVILIFLTSIRSTLVTALSIPFAAIGSVLALLMTGTALDMSAMIGLLMLAGIVVTNAVAMTPLAITVIAGLITSTLRTLILLPILYRLVEGVAERRRAKVE